MGGLGGLQAFVVSVCAFHLPPNWHVFFYLTLGLAHICDFPLSSFFTIFMQTIITLVETVCPCVNNLLTPKDIS